MAEISANAACGYGGSITESDKRGLARKGWLAVLGCALATFWSGALIFGYPGLMGQYWREAFGVGTAATGPIMTFVIVSLGIFTFFCGKWHMRIGTRASILVGTAILAVAMVCVTLANNIYMVYVWAFLNGTSSCFVYAPGLTTVQNWFPNKRGLVTGIVNLVFGISAAVMSPLFNVMLNTMGYVAMNWTVLGLILVTNIIAALLAEMPDRAHLTNGQRAVLAAEQAKMRGNSASGASESMTPRQAVRTKGFWFVWLAWCFMGAAGISMVSLSSSYGTALGLSGVLVLTAFNLTNGLSRIVAGALSDLIGRNVLGCAAFLLAAVGYAALPFASSQVMVCVLAAFVGFAFGTLFAITAPLGTDMFGLKYFGMIFGLIFTAYGFVGGIVGPLLSNAVLQATGSYALVFGYLAVFCVLAALFIMLARGRKPRS